MYKRKIKRFPSSHTRKSRGKGWRNRAFDAAPCTGRAARAFTVKSAKRLPLFRRNNFDRFARVKARRIDRIDTRRIDERTRKAAERGCPAAARGNESSG